MFADPVALPAVAVAATHCTEGLRADAAAFAVVAVGATDCTEWAESSFAKSDDAHTTASFVLGPLVVAGFALVPVCGTRLSAFGAQPTGAFAVLARMPLGRNA